MLELPPPPPKQVRVERYVERYPGDLTMEKGIRQMLDQGWTLADSSTHKSAWTPGAGIFTERKIHTVTFTK